jgi:hypothetical protein
MAFRVLALLLLVLPASGQTPAGSSASLASSVPVPSDQRQQETAPGNSQNERFMTQLTPHPYLFLGPSLMEAGYAPVAYRIEGGLNVESRHWVMLASAAYDDGRQVNDGDQPNPKGHDRYLDSGIYFRPSWQPFSGQGFVGFGWRWSQLSTTNYSKTSDRPQIGGGYDISHRPCPGCSHGFSMRITANWVMAGNDWQNGSHGPEMTLTFPTPREKRHWFYQERFGVDRFHATVTDRSDRPLANSERADRALACYAQFGILIGSDFNSAWHGPR